MNLTQKRLMIDAAINSLSLLVVRCEEMIIDIEANDILISEMNQRLIWMEEMSQNAKELLNGILL